MKRTISLLTAVSILLTLCFGGFSTTVKSASQDKTKSKPFVMPPGLEKNLDKLPARAKQALTAEAKNKWDSFSPKQKEKIQKKLGELIRNTMEQKTEADAPAESLEKDDQEITLSYVDRDGKHQLIKAHQRKAKAKPGKQATLPAKGSDKKAIWATDWASAKPIAKTRMNHATARRNSKAVTTQAGCTKGPEEFIRKFFEGALVRPPRADELSYWMNAFAQAQGQSNLLATAQNLGYTLFQSSEYSARGRSNHDFVYDCYKAWLQREPDQGGWDFWTAQANQNGQAAVLPAFPLSIEFNEDVSHVCNVATFDGDNDGLPDNFENNVGDNFTPFYHISQGEWDQFATFQDSIPQTVKTRFGQQPISHFRVVPLPGSIRYNYIAGRYESFLRVDYWTMWDHDSGLVGDLCGLAPGEDVLQGSNAHDIDNERSALLVSAPAVWNGSNYEINLDPNAYSSLSLYTAAHERTPLAHNSYSNFPESPRSAGNRFDLWLSLSKHGTYAFNPDFYPLFQTWMIAVIYVVIEYWLYTQTCYGYVDQFWIEMFGPDAYGWSCDTWWYVFIAINYYVTILLVTCLVERFQEQGGQLSNFRINLGEPQRSGFPGNPINGSSFIQEDDDHTGHLFDKLVQPLDFESLF